MSPAPRARRYAALPERIHGSAAAFALARVHEFLDAVAALAVISRA